LIQIHPEFAHYLGPNANIVKHPNFESVICKVQSGRENLLTVAEADAISHLKFEILLTGFFEKQRKHSEQRCPAPYRPVHHLLPTINIVERQIDQMTIES
jgi:hypothetical protein